jgi:hypothetical protein
VKFTVFEPGCTVTALGNVSGPVPVMVTPKLVGVGPVKITVACAGDPPVTLDGKIATLCKVTGGGGAVSVRLAVFDTPL